METTLDLAAIFERDAFDTETYEALKELSFSGNESFNRFRELLAQLESEAAAGNGNVARSALKLGKCYLLIGDFARAAEWFERAEDGADKAYHLGCAFREMRRHDASREQFQKAEAAGWNRIECGSLRAESLIICGNADEAAEILNGLKAEASESADWHYAMGRYHRHLGDLEAAMDAFEKAISLNERHGHAKFHLAYLLDLHGSDDQALELYEDFTDWPYVHADALMNLAVIYEDQCEFDQAAMCLRRVLAANPANDRAHLYLKDVLAAGDMYIDEQQAMDAEKRNAVLDIPVSDFELSVRSRNCLKKMNIHTLGDLLRTSEAELLSYKNFGETSLKEIKVMLNQKGLVLGQLAHEKRTGMPVARPPTDPNINPEVANRPVSSLQLSVRSRKCLQLLGISTIGELSMRTENELMGSRNFGQTSLTEIKNCLTELGLSLRG